MSQKINPKSLRLGNSLTWSIKVQSYGCNKYKYLNSFYKFNKNLYFLDNLDKQKRFVNYTEFWYNKSKINFKLYLKNNVSDINYYFLLNRLLSNIKYLFSNNIQVNIRIYSNFINFYSSKALVNYGNYLFKKWNYTPKKIFSILVYLLTKQLNSKKICYGKFGPLKLNLKGFKIILTGRFEASKNQMSKELKVNIGALPLTTLNNNIDFWTTKLYTKLGVCNLKIWLFYQII